ncbi:MAG: aggregation factor core [Hyphomicrobiales bacterium]
MKAQADLNIRFDEGAPKDRFTITNFGACDIGPTSISIDLSGSTFGLVFDVTAKGAGVEVFQPFEVTIGRENLSKIPMVKDGDNIIKLDLTGLKSKESFAFTIDVDDTKKSREITVSNSELQGAKVVAKDQKQTISAPFQENASATLELSSCGA